MHGMIFAEMKRYSDSKLGKGGWDKVLDEAKLRDHVYVLSQPYPDVEAQALVSAMARLTKQPTTALLEDFGHGCAGQLVVLYGRLLKPQWRTLDVIENAEASVHTVVRMRNPGATPPVLTPTRTSPKVLHLTYQSPRKMCHFGIGLCHGIAAHFQEKIKVSQSRCMLQGAPNCDIVIEQA